MVRKLLAFVCGLIFGATVTACATATFPYHYFGLDLKEGKLLGPTAADDLPLATCDASVADQSPCVAMMSAAFLEMKKDYLDTKNALIACQKQLAVQAH